MSLYLESLAVKDFRGIRDFNCRLGMCTLVVGDNGEGKTSLLESIVSVLEGGHDPGDIRLGADEAVISLALSDGARAIKIIQPTSYELKVLNPDGSPKKAPATWLKQLAPGLAFDPMAFLDSDPKERAAFLLKTLPLTFSAGEVNAALDMPNITGPVSLSRLNEIRDGKYEERRQVNVQVRDTEGAIADMRKTLPADDEQDWGAERDRLAKEVSAIDGNVKAAAAEIELEAEQSRTARTAEAEAQIAALRQQLAEYITTLNKVAAEALAEETKELKAQQSALSLQLGTVREKADQQQRAAGIRSAIEERTKALKGTTLKEIRLTKAIKAIDELKHQKLKELPIEGLDLKSDSRGRPIILIDGIPLDKLNRQKQIYLAIQAVSLACGQMPLMVCEVSELTEPRIVELSEAAEAAGIQLILATRLRDEPLRVLSIAEYRETMQAPAVVR